MEALLAFVSPQGDRDYVVEEFTADVGTVHRREGLRDTRTLSDHEKAMLERIPVVEAELEREQGELQMLGLLTSAVEKVEEYVRTRDLKADAGLTPEELAAYSKDAGGEFVGADAAAEVAG